MRLAAPPTPEPPFAIGPQNEEQVIDMLAAIFEPHEATAAEQKKARADALEISRRTHEHAQVVAEHQRTDPICPIGR